MTKLAAIHSVEKLTAIRHCLVDNMPLSPQSLKHLTESMDRWWQGEDLGDAFGITDSKAERRFRRDTELKEFAAQLAGSLWTKSKRIEQEVEKIHQKKRTVNYSLKKIDSVYPLPESWRQIYNILKS